MMKSVLLGWRRLSPASFLNLPKWLPIALGILILLVGFHYFYNTYPAVPGNDPVYPLGWWGWSDQGYYIKSAKALAHGDLSPSQHLYPPLYPLLGSLLIFSSPRYWFYIQDIVLTLIFFVSFVSLFSRYIGTWLASVSAVTGMVFIHPFMLQWVIPWTSTLGATLIMISLLLLDRYARDRAANTSGSTAFVVNAGLFGLAVGLQAVTRPVDILVVSPTAIIYAVCVCQSAVSNRFEGPRTAAWSAFAGAAGFAVPVAGFFAFNELVYGSPFGTYFAGAMNMGFDPNALPVRFFSQLLASQTFFGEQNADWLSVVPILALCICFLPPLFLIGPLVFRAAALCAAVQFAVYYSFTDIIPTGTFRYFNIHYFKWLAPTAIASAIYCISAVFSHARKVRVNGLLAMVAGICIAICGSSITATQDVVTAFKFQKSNDWINLTFEKKAIDFIDVSDVSGEWTNIYFSRKSDIILDGSRKLAAIFEYRLLPIDGGLRILFTEPMQAHELKIRFDPSIKVASNLSASDITPVDVHFGLGLPFSQQKAPAHPPRTYVIGDPIDFSTAGDADGYLGEGWSGAEPWGRWIDGSKGDISLDLRTRPTSDLLLRAVLGGFIGGKHPKTLAELYAGDTRIGELEIVNGTPETYVFKIPNAAVEPNGKLRLEIRNLTPASPQKLGLSSDPRELGIGVTSLSVVQLDGYSTSDEHAESAQ